jgi:hypothetical protein
MIYRVVTGKRLFDKTSRFLPEIIKAKQIAALKGHSVTEVFIDSSHLFWQSSRQEFNERIEADKKNLELVSFHVPLPARNMLLRELVKEKEELEHELKVHIKSKIFKSKKSHEILIKSTRKIISRYRRNWEKGINVPKTREDLRKRIVLFFQKLEELKIAYERLLRTIAKLAKDRNPTVSAYAILNIIFDIVCKAMYDKQWEHISTEDIAAPNEESFRITSDETSSIEATLTSE